MKGKNISTRDRKFIADAYKEKTAPIEIDFLKKVEHEVKRNPGFYKTDSAGRPMKKG